MGFYAVSWLTWWAFLGLKLSGAWANVSWWVITAPLWGVGLLSFAFLVAIIVALDASASDVAERHVKSWL